MDILVPELEAADSHPEAEVHTAQALPVPALLQTRCLCQRVVEVPNNPPPKTVTVDLVPLKGQLASDKRTFYLTGETATPEGDKVLVYREGPALDKPRLIVPGLQVPQDLHSRR